MTFYVNENETNRRPSRELFYVAAVVLVVAAMLWSCAPPPSPAQPGDPIPDPGEGQVWRFQLPGPLPDWVVVMQEALALRRTTLDEFVAAGKAQAQAVIDAPGTDAEVAAAKLLLRGYTLIARELEDIPLRSDIRSREVGVQILRRIEISAQGDFTNAERAALAQAAFDYCRSVIAAEAATQAAIWNTMATTAIDLPSDLGSPVDAPEEIALSLDASSLSITWDADYAGFNFGDPDTVANITYENQSAGQYVRGVPTFGTAEVQWVDFRSITETKRLDGARGDVTDATVNQSNH